ncbi:target of EGR1 protein 1-like [Nerophis ophidion]|uniref:target of EGR1 protein 1-like n=1 Tax=Nerophis ophidion TaxID=159077 RepID=UPI002ADF655C|nr:target of EGR1 protein 1-like [Nerophis ophidion]
MTSSMVVPVIDVQHDNFKELWPAMVLAMTSSSFLALDTELSGLGNRTSLLAACIEDRYKAICHAARSRSILSLGIACYKKLAEQSADTYLVQVYNLTLLCSEEYIIEPQSVQFLVQHGFDFNKQYAHGIPYHKGNDKGGSDNQGVHIRALFTEILRARKPLVLHNGLIDMAFLYQNFYAHLPDRLATFTADLSEMFPAGIFDTKYVTEFDLRLSASYLEYAYKKCKLDNSRNESSGGTGRHIHLQFCQYAGAMSRYVDHRACPTVAPHQVQADICHNFSAFGWCPKGTECPSSHDTDLIILHDDNSRTEKRRKRKRHQKKKKKEEEDPAALEAAPRDKKPHMDLEPGKMIDNCKDGEDMKTLNDGEDMKTLNDGEDMKTLHDGEEDMKTLNDGEDMKTLHDGEEDMKTLNDGEDMKTLHDGEEDMKTLHDGEEDMKTLNDGDAMKTLHDGEEDMKTLHDGEEDMKTLNDGDAMKADLKVCEDTTESPRCDKKVESGSHRAGFDAFMTGYIFAYSCATVQQAGGEEEEERAWLPDSLNKIYLSGKAAPLNIVKSTFSKSSKAHVQKMALVWASKR